MLLSASSIMCAIAIGSNSSSVDLSTVLPPRSVKVLPVFFVPRDVAGPTKDQSERFIRHLDWTRRRYAELLPGHVTFGVARKTPLVYKAPETLEFYRRQPEGGAPRFVGELLDHLKFTRFNCPYILLVMLMNPVDGEPGGGGRPINGGFDTGGGVVILSSYNLDHAPNCQSTFQHELGHAFGLPHVDCYGYDILSNDSLMSYNPRHHTNGFAPSPTPGKFIPEDLRALALNQRVFPGLKFEPSRDVPKGYAICPQIVGLGPMELPGQLGNVTVATNSGGDVRSLLVGPITPDAAWRSDPTPSGWASVEFTFPVQAPLTRVVVHLARPVQAVRVLAVRSGKPLELAKSETSSLDSAISIPRTVAGSWRIELQTGPNESVAVRGIEFFTAKGQIFPPLVPFRSGS